jgi:hypothetical protein
MDSQKHLPFCVISFATGMKSLAEPKESRRHVESDFRGFAACMPYSDIFAFRSVVDRNA